jgi:hypothetical protein
VLNFQQVMDQFQLFLLYLWAQRVLTMMEVDAGASLHINQPASHVSEFESRDEEGRSPHFDLEFNVIKCLSC